MAPQKRVPCCYFFVCSDHQSNTENISTKFYKEMLNRSQEKEERKRTPLKWTKITKNAPSPGLGDRSQFFMFVTTSAMPQCLYPKFQKINIQSFSKNGGTYIQRDRQTNKLKQVV